MRNYSEYVKNVMNGITQEMSDRNINSLHLFTEVFKNLSDPANNLSIKNNVTLLMNANFNSHLKIHRGYYDSKYDDVLKVRDADTGELIRKDTSVLLADGRFISKDSDKLIHNIRDWRTTIINAKNGNQADKDRLKDRYLFVSDYSSYLPVDLDKIIVSMSIESLCAVIGNIFAGYCDDYNILRVPENINQINDINFLRKYEHQNVAYLINNGQITLDYTGKIRSMYSIPETSPFFPGMKISAHFDLNAEMEKATRNGIIPCININTDFVISWNGRARTGHEILNLAYDHKTLFPFAFSILVGNRVNNGENRRTANNDGLLLAYQTKVNDLKCSFLMIDAEKHLFDMWHEEYQVACAQWSNRSFQAKLDSVPFTESKPIKSSSKEPIYLGIEVEAVSNGLWRTKEKFNKTIKDIADSEFGNHAVMKRDGSLHDDFGLEIVTIPATLAYHKKMFEEHFFGKNAFNSRLQATESCGIHVHLSKKCFTPITLGRFIAFINSVENQSFINDMSNRGANVYCVRAKNKGRNLMGIDQSVSIGIKGCIDGKPKRGLSFREAPRADITRRVSVNLDNANTVEVRIFKSSVSQNNVLRKVEFCESLLKFVRVHSNQQMTMFDYINFILDKQNKRDYPYIVRWLASKNYIAHDWKRVKGVDKLVHVYSINKVPIPKTPYHNKKNYPEYFKEQA